MSKFTIETDDKEEAELYLQASNYKLVLWDLDSWLRNHVKYNPDNLSGDQLDILDKTRDQLRELLYENHVSLD